MLWNGCKRLTISSRSLVKKCFIVAAVMFLAVVQLKSVHLPAETHSTLRIVSTSQSTTDLSSSRSPDAPSPQKPICLRPRFSGPVFQVVNTTVPSLEELSPMFPHVQTGGHWEPTHCRQRQRVAVLIPFRDRWNQLPILIKYLHTILVKQWRHYTVYVIEQNDTSPFNRAKLLNVGVREALKLEPDLNCFVLHDVDTVPQSLYAIYKCNDDKNMAMQMATFQKKRLYRPAYRGYTGGVLSIWRDQYEAVNGFSNEFWGWGGEDDDFYNRLKKKQFDVIRDLTRSAGFFSLEHELTVANPDRQTIIKEHKKDIYREGLNNTEYAITTHVRNHLFTFLSVDLLCPHCTDSNVD